MVNINRFKERLENIGIKIELGANYPWIYLRSVNGITVIEKFQANHGFTAFYLKYNTGIVFSDRRKVFLKIRQLIAYDNYMKLTQEVFDYERSDM